MNGSTHLWREHVIYNSMTFMKSPAHTQKQMAPTHMQTHTHTHTSERTLGLSGTHPLACDAHRSNEWAVLFSE